ncbi:MAG: methylated-DNA--[Eggerthellaceae bacterium]|nr:methylated-DNA--[protein]-cysteine S-methyltransferase [Eggerthellaceae bacterium]
MSSKGERKRATVPGSYASCEYESPFGTITLAAGDDGLKGLWFDGQRYYAGTLDAPMERGDNVHLDAARAWLDEYFAGGDPEIARLELAPIGGEFRKVVWQLIREIPQGEVRTYGELASDAARRMDKPKGSARAVGGAVGHNPISV